MKRHKRPNVFLSNSEASHRMRTQHQQPDAAMVEAALKYHNDARSLAMRSPSVRLAIRTRERPQRRADRETDLVNLLGALVDGSVSLRLT